MKFYAVAIKPYNNGNSRWLVYELVNTYEHTYEDGAKLRRPYPEASMVHLDKLWPESPEDRKKSQAVGFSFHEKYGYHFHCKGLGMSHTAILKEDLRRVLENMRGEKVKLSDIELEVLG
jgi:hypothetical protein